MAERVNANLPLPLSRLIIGRDSGKLPLPLSRQLGAIDDGTPTEPIQPPKPSRRMQGVMALFDSRQSTAHTIKQCQTWRHDGKIIANDHQILHDVIFNVSSCQQLKTLPFIALAKCQQSKISSVYPLHNCQQHKYIAFVPLTNCIHSKLSPTIGYIHCAKVNSARVKRLYHCNKAPIQSVKLLKLCTDNHYSGGFIERDYQSKISPAIAVPCRYYPIPEQTPDKPNQVCRIRPPSSRLPLPLLRRRTNLPASSLPMPLQCWHDTPPRIIPNLRSYIVHNSISATIAGIAIDPLSFNIQTDIHSYCWQGNIEITANDYQRIKAKLEVSSGNEPLITVTINGFIFAFLAEEQQRSRQFTNSSYNLSGRSITARLGADYAGTQSGLLDQANYASQIVNQQLNGLSVSIEDWGINDWLIPANSYSVTGKTPIAVIADIAKAAGGFVITHPNQPTLSIKPRWQKPAWELATATPDVIIPVDVIRQIDDKKRINPRYNTVTLTSNTQGGVVYRQTQGRDKDAPADDNSLYTDRDVIIPAGIAILSDSGIHADYVLTMRWSDKYNIPLADLGQIWQINDPEGAWRGVVVGVSVAVRLQDNVPTVWQTVSIDRYLDN